jgi:hypothetical protein
MNIAVHSIIVYKKPNLPMRGIDSAAFGVDSDNNSSKTKNATNIFIPEITQLFQT